MHTFHGFTGLLSSLEQEVNVYSANYQNPLIGFDFPSYFGAQAAVARIYFARFQRAPEGSDHSTTKGSHNVVNSCRMRFGEFCWIHTIMLSNGSVDAERHRLRLPWQMRDSKRSQTAFNPNIRHIDWVRHFR
ncbi:MAG: hypothetical protein WB566_10120 [Terriglobales bacterium]